MLNLKLQTNMKAEGKRTLREYFKAINIDKMPFGTKDFPYTRLMFVKGYVSMFNHMEETGIWGKMKAIYPFRDTLVHKRDINLLDPNGPRLNLGKGWQTSLNLSKSKKNKVKRFAKKASANLTRNID